MSLQNFTEYKLDSDAYATFDALSLKQHLIDNLNDNSEFTDQIYEGSNINSVIDTIAYSYHTLLFYLNQSGSETQFSNAQLIENMTKVVSILNYGVRGYKTSRLPIEVSHNSPSNITKILKRYSYITSNGINYTFTKDVLHNQLVLDTIENEALAEGKWIMHPAQVAMGEENEVIQLTVSDILNDNVIKIDHENIHVYIKESDNKWYEWIEVDSLVSKRFDDRVFTKKINDRGFYDITFGGGFSGKSLDSGNIIQIVYLESTGSTLSANKINSTVSRNVVFDTLKWREIQADIYDDQSIILTQGEFNEYKFTNRRGATSPTIVENVESIRKNASKLFHAQNRVVTLSDYNAHISANLPNIIKSWSVASNDQYKLFMDYFDDNTQIVNNQFRMTDSCSFNNIYIFSIINNNDADSNKRISNSIKQLIVDSFQDVKSPQTQIVPVEPLLTYASFGNGDENLNITYSKPGDLNIIKSLIADEIIKFFEPLKIGDALDLDALTKNILNIDDGIVNISTNSSDGLSMTLCDASHGSTKTQFITYTKPVEYFRYIALKDSSKVIDKINII